MAKVDCAVRLWEMLFSCVTRGSVLGPLLFNSYMYEICFFKRPANIDFGGYADNSTPYTYSSNMESVLDNLKGALEKMFHWFSTKNLVANAGKSHLLTSPKMPVDIHIFNSKILSE